MFYGFIQVKSRGKQYISLYYAITCSFLFIAEAHADPTQEETASQEQKNWLPSIGVKVEYTASNPLQSTLTQSSMGTSLFSTGASQSKWTPWLLYNRQNWQHKLLLQASSLNHYSSTAASTANTNLTLGVFAIESERIVQSAMPRQPDNSQQQEKQDLLYWRIGLGLHAFIPYVRQQDSLYTPTEQESITQNARSLQSQLAQIQIHVPLSLNLPIQDHIQIGLGIRTHLDIQRQETDYTLEWTQHLSTNPTFCIQLY